MKSLVKREKGFTLIEIVIVLAIAAALIAVVLLAVGGANRSSRDTKRVNNVGQAASASEQWASNHNGDMTSITSAYFSSNYPNVTDPTAGNTVQVVASAPTLTGPTAIDLLPTKNCAGTTGKSYYAIYYFSETQQAQQCKDNS